MNDYELVITSSKYFEHHLRQNLQAEGTGLGELARSVEDHLPEECMHQLRIIAAVRNRLCHEWGYDELQDREGFVRAVEAAKSQLIQPVTKSVFWPLWSQRRTGTARHPVRLYLVLALLLLIAILRGINFQFPVPDVLKSRPYIGPDDPINNPGPYGGLIPVGEPRPADDTTPIIPQRREGTGSRYSRFSVNDPGRYGGLVPTGGPQSADSLHGDSLDNYQMSK